jgi:TRAP-type mannitol/chloroaromatic compound transport system substrate-binding protein
MSSRLKGEAHAISRRHFARLAAVGAATAAARPATAQQTTESVKWRLTSSFPKNLDTLFGAANTICRIVGELTDGRFSIQPFAAGEIVPGLQVLDAVSNATVECGQTYTGYYIGKEPAMIFDGSLPFGLTPRQHPA